MEKMAVTDAEVGVLAHLLRKVDFFSPLTVGQMEKILPHIRLFSYDRGETVFSQGEQGDAFYILSTGKVSVRMKNGFFSFTKTVSSLGPGSFFGEIALISDAPRGATVVCEEPCQIFVLVAADFKFVLHENPAAAEEMAKIAARRKFDSAHTK
ncbi:MAG: cyclic nucleotide-binding domain-containing protein [Elusimicrobiota bacterium]|mgnify:CR=1 FL=1